MSASPPKPPEPERRGWGVDVGLVLWPSFLAACAASLLFFAAVDPALLKDAGPRLFADLDREAGYVLGFIFFWVISAVASALSVYLVRTERGRRRSAGSGPP
ncbi:MAG TPA: hypothetical protein VGR86_14575 [Steroidobacteraceae bacterium]|nr:hypothetical protein [Steroidobacteraceae bacterium]